MIEFRPSARLVIYGGWVFASSSTTEQPPAPLRRLTMPQRNATVVFSKKTTRLTLTTR